MFGKKSKLERVKADAKADYLKCGALDQEDRLHRVFTSKVATYQALTDLGNSGGN